MKNNYLDLTLVEINDLLKRKEIKVSDLVNEALENVEENKDLNYLITLNKEEALEKAKELDEKEVDNLLFGIPIVIKDNIMTKGIRTTGASKYLEDFISPYDAFVVQKIKELNMVIIGKGNLDEFAMGSFGKSSYFGIAKNFYDNKRTCGGSSGGTAGTVVSNMAYLALGSDTGGSVRQPASYNGLVGMKPSYGRLSRNGIIAFSNSLDQISILSKNVYENAVLLGAIDEKDENDLTQHDIDSNFTVNIDDDPRGYKIAIPSYFINDEIDKNIKNRLLEVLKMLDIKYDIVDIPNLDKNYLLYKIISYAEASSNLARFDGLRYGYQTDKYQDLNDFIKKNRSESFGEEVKKRILLGTYLLSSENKKDHYHKALILRNELKEEVDKIFKDYDFIIGPTTSTVAPKLSQDKDTKVDDNLLTFANLLGLPALSLNISEGELPFGMQIIANSFEEAKIYQLANYIEKKVGVLSV